jgi:hypothetical protein
MEQNCQFNELDLVTLSVCLFGDDEIEKRCRGDERERASMRREKKLDKK